MALIDPIGKGADRDLARDLPAQSALRRNGHRLAPVPSKHARAVERALRREGRSDVADRLVASGSTKAKRPVARLTPRERLIEEHTGVAFDDLRRLTLAAWRETADGPGFLTPFGLAASNCGWAGPVPSSSMPAEPFTP